MTLFNSANPRVAAAQAKVLETLTSIPDEYGAVFVIDDHQAELTAAVAANHKAAHAQLVRTKAATLNRPGRKGRSRAGLVFDMKGRKIA